jgi:hypothetical protein
MAITCRDIIWLTKGQRHPVGLVKAYDDVEQAWKYYIGSGNGWSEDMDIQRIMDWGQKYDSLRWIAELEEQPKPREYLREFDEAGPTTEGAAVLQKGLEVYSRRVSGAINGTPKAEPLLLILMEDAVAHFQKVPGAIEAADALREVAEIKVTDA